MSSQDSASRQIASPGAESWLVTPEDNRTPVISVVMPTLDEEDGIQQCLEWATEAFETLEMPGEIILSDSSSDRTPEIGRAFGAHVVEPDQPGYGYAYQYAFEHARGEYIVIGDADTTYDFREIPRLLEPVREGEADMCMGSRLEGEIKDGAMPALHQYVGNPLLTAFLNAFYDAGVSDAHSGFRVIHRDALDELALSSNGMEFASEMVMRAGECDLDIEEQPIVYHEREGEATLDSFRDGWRHVRFMLLNAPQYLFSIPGLLIGLVGLVLMGVVMSGISVNGVTLGQHSLIAGSLLVIAGYQVGSMGIFATVAGDPIQDGSDAVSEWLNDHFQLETVAFAGLGLVLAGSAYAGVLLFQWVSSGFTQLPLLSADIVALTTIVVGIQTMFGAFFIGTVAEAGCEQKT